MMVIARIPPHEKFCVCVCGVAQMAELCAAGPSASYTLLIGRVGQTNKYNKWCVRCVRCSASMCVVI